MSDFSFSLYAQVGSTNGGYTNVADGTYTLPMSGIRAQVSTYDPNNTECRIYNTQDPTVSASTGYIVNGPDIIHVIPDSIIVTVVNHQVTIPSIVGPYTITLDAQDSASVASGNYELIADCGYYLLVGSQSLNYHYANYTNQSITLVGGTGTATGPGVSPALLGRPSTHYNRVVAKLNTAQTDTLGITFWRSDKPVPLLQSVATGKIWDTPAAGVAVTSTASDRDPRIAIDARTLLYLIFNRPASGAMVTRSDDDGATWNTPTLAITGGTHPTIVSADGRTLAAAVTTTGTGTSAVRHITAVYRGAGDAAFGTPFTFNTSTTGSAGTALVVADDSFGIAFAAEGPDRLVMHVLLAGATATSDWWSANNGATWTRIPLS